MVLSQDARFLATLRSVSEPTHMLRAVGSEIDFSAALMSHQGGVAVLDSAAIATPVANLTARLHAQFPDLVLIVAGGSDEQAALAAQITDGSVHRFLHKPVSEQRVRLFVEAAWRRHEEARSSVRLAAAAGPPARRLPWWLVAAALVVVAAPAAWFALRPAHPGNTAAGTAPAADDTTLEDLLQRADHALAQGNLVAPPAENAADLFRAALRRNARDPRAVSGLDQVIDHLLADADAQLQDHHLDAAQQLADLARNINPNNPRVSFFAAQIGAQRERLVLSKAQRAAASGDVSSALAVLDEATRGEGHRSTLVDEARQQLAQKQVATRVAGYLDQAHAALASGALVQPTEQNARFYVESARALAPNDPAVQQARAELATRLLSEAHKSVAAGNAQAAAMWTAAAADSGADPAEVASLTALAEQLPAPTHPEPLLRTAAPAAAGPSTVPAAAAPEPVPATATAPAPAPATTAANATTVDNAESVAVSAPEPRTAATAMRAPSAAPPAAAAASSIPAVVNASTLTRIRYVQPNYPPSARDRGIEGWVDVQFVVRADGTVGEANVIGAQPTGVFEQSALDAVRHWRYQPAGRDGQGLEQRATIRLRFAVRP